MLESVDKGPRDRARGLIESTLRLASHNRTAFDTARDQAIASVTAKDYGSALAQFDALRKSAPTEFMRQGLHLTRDEVASKFVAQLTESKSGATSSAGTHPREGRSQFSAEYAELKGAAEESLRERNFGMAVERLGAARKANPERYKADGLQVQMEMAIRGDLHDRAAAAGESGFLELECDQPCQSRIRCQAATGSWTKSRQWETQRTWLSSARATVCPPAKANGVWPSNDAWLRAALS
jgi:hypothetical protein